MHAHKLHVHGCHFISPDPINSFIISISLQHEHYSPWLNDSIQSVRFSFDGLNQAQETDELKGRPLSFVHWSPSSGYHSPDCSRHGVRQELCYKISIISRSNSFHSSLNPPPKIAPSALFYAYRPLRLDLKSNSFHYRTPLISRYLLDTFSCWIIIVGRARISAMLLPPFGTDAIVIRWPFVEYIRVMVLSYHQDHHAPYLHHRRSPTMTHTDTRRINVFTSDYHRWPKFKPTP